jgi:hypothetical protein
MVFPPGFFGETSNFKSSHQVSRQNHITEVDINNKSFEIDNGSTVLPNI